MRCLFFALGHGDFWQYGFIKYAAEKRENYIFLYVWDDGRGISQQRQKEILDCLCIQNIDEMLHKNIGYQNVFRRLDLLYPGRVVPFLESPRGCREIAIFAPDR